MDTNYTIENCTVMGAAQKRNYSKLPKVKYFRVQSRGLVGSMSNRHERKTGAWSVLVSCEGENGLRLVTDISAQHGMLIKGEFATKEQAFAAAMEYKNKWGVATSASGKKSQQKTEEAVKAAQQVMLESFIKNMGVTEEMARQVLGL